MAEGAAGREGPVPVDTAGGEDDPRAAADAASGDAAPAASGGRMRDRRSGVALPGAAAGDTEAGLLEAARATPRRSSIIKVSRAAAAQSVVVGVGEVGDPPGGRMFIAPGRHRRQGIVFSHLLHCQTFLPSPEVPRLLALRSRSDFPSDSQGKVPLCALRFCGLMDAFPHFLGKLL